MSSQPDRTFAQLYLAAAELEALRDLVARQLVAEGQPIAEPEPIHDVSLLWSLHTCMAEARFYVDGVPQPRHKAVLSEVDRIFEDMVVAFTRVKDMNDRLLATRGYGGCTRAIAISRYRRSADIAGRCHQA